MVPAPAVRALGAVGERARGERRARARAAGAHAGPERAAERRVVAEAHVAVCHEGVLGGAAATGLDFWLLFYVQFAVFGAGIATNQNLSMILESEGSPQFAGLGVALFALGPVFSALDQAKADLGIESYTLSQTTLEQVFLNISSEQLDDTAGPVVVEATVTEAKPRVVATATATAQ